MTRYFWILYFLLVTLTNINAQESNSFYDLKANLITGEEINFSNYQGKVILVVNSASKCGTTVQFKELQQVYELYKDQGLVVMAFPSSNFGNAEYKKDQEIHEFCKSKYNTTFLLFQKNNVKGKAAQEVFKFLTNNQDTRMSGDVTFNFEKFLVGKDGQVKARFGSFTNPMSERVRDKIQELLAEKI